jgi:hypothetical protein
MSGEELFVEVLVWEVLKSSMIFYPALISLICRLERSGFHFEIFLPFISTKLNKLNLEYLPILGSSLSDSFNLFYVFDFRDFCRYY